MNAKQLRLLEDAFAAEIRAATTPGHIHLIQSKSREAKRLVADGLLREEARQVGGQFPCEVRGLELTELGRLTYCMSCGDGDENPDAGSAVTKPTLPDDPVNPMNPISSGQ